MSEIEYTNRIYKKEILQSIDEGSTLDELAVSCDVTKDKLQEILDGKIEFAELGIYAEFRDNEVAVELSNCIKKFIDDELSLDASKSSIVLALNNIMRDAKKEKGLI